jgi:hypothetical protein
MQLDLMLFFAPTSNAAQIKLSAAVTGNNKPRWKLDGEFDGYVPAL